MVKYRVEKIVLDVEGLEADLETDLQALIKQYAADSETPEDAIRTRIKGIIDRIASGAGMA